MSSIYSVLIYFTKYVYLQRDKVILVVKNNLKQQFNNNKNIMKYIVLISDGVLNHSFQVFTTKEEAEEYANKIASKHDFVEVNELINSVYL